jgi:hypothetical protein
VKEIDQPTQVQPTEIAQEPKVFDLSNPTLRTENMGRIIAETLRPGDRIVGISSWEEVAKIVDILVKKVVIADDQDSNTKHNLKNNVDLKNSFDKHDKQKGFYGASRNFEMEFQPTDITFLNADRIHPTNPDLALTFTLLRTIFSSTLPKKGEVVSALCTISMVDSGVTSKSNFYKDGVEKVHHYYGAVAIRNLDRKVFNKINRLSSSLSSFGQSTHKRKGF